MTRLDLYMIAGVLVVVLALHAVLTRAHLLWKVFAFNLMGTGLFLFIMAAPARRSPSAADPVPEAMVLTGIVVAVASTALALGIALRVTGRSDLPFLPDDDDGESE